MSRQYAIEATLTVDGDEQDCPVRGHVDHGPVHGGGWGGVLDGEPEAFVDGAWWALDALELAPRDRERIEEALCDEANDDDSSQCIEWGDGFYEVAS